MPGTAFIREATKAWKLLNGIICIHKPSLPSFYRTDLKRKICEDLNSMKCRKPATIVEVRRIEGDSENNERKLITSTPRDRELVHASVDGPDTIQVLKGINYSDHPLVVGPRYQHEDIKLWDVSKLGSDTSGLCVMGINDGTKTAMTISHMRWLRAYTVSGRFGIATENNFHTGRIIDKSTYHKIHKDMLDRLLATSQAAHQRTMFETTGLGLQSELSYELASQGLLRPAEKTGPVVYSLKCTNFKLPDFDIEVHVINETEDFLMSLIYEYGHRLHSTATCTKVRCIKYGPFTLQNALLKKHWNVQNIINNTIENAEILKQFDMTRRDPLIDSHSRDLRPSQDQETPRLSST